MEELDIDFISRNMPKGSPKRVMLEKLGGKQQVPFLVDTDDPKNPVMMYESDDIIAHLEKRFG